MSKITLNNLADLNNSNTVITTINNNNSTLITAMDNTLSRDGTAPNQMEVVLDMNANRVINIAAPIGSQDAVRLIDLQATSGNGAALAAAQGNAAASAAAASSSAASASTFATAASSSATAASISATSASSSAASAASSAASILIGGIWNNTSTVTKTSSYTVLDSDSGRTVSLGGAACYQLIFTAPATYSTGFMVFVQNVDTVRAKIININGTYVYLWPLYSGFVFKSGTSLYHTIDIKWTPRGYSVGTRPNSVTFFVDPVLGSDSIQVTDGLATGAGALLTIQEAVHRVHNFVEHGDVLPTIKLADGTHQVGAGVEVFYPMGHTELLIQGNTVTPTNCVVNCNAGGICFNGQEPMTFTIDGVELTTSGNGSTGLNARQFTTLDIGNVVFGNFPLGTHINLVNHASCGVIGNITVAGSAVVHCSVGQLSFFSNTTFAVTVNGGLTFTDFMTVAENSIMTLGAAYGGAGAGGATTGQTYSVTTGGILQAGGTTIPGSIAGATSFQGQFFA